MHRTTGAPYLAYSDCANSNKATVMTFTNGAWKTVGAAGFSAGRADYTSLAMHPTTGQPNVAYSEFDINRKATLMTFNNGAWSAVGSRGFSAGQPQYISLVVGGSLNRQRAAGRQHHCCETYPHCGLGQHTFTQISAGDTHTCGPRTDNTALAVLG